jgi:hypothetical protein
MTSSVAQAGQTIVTFLTQEGTSAPVSEQRVFDFSITRDAQTYYNDLMSIIQYALLDGKKWTPSGGVGEDFGSDAEALATVKAAVTALNEWSQFRTASVDGEGNPVQTDQTWGTYGYHYGGVDLSPGAIDSPSTMSRYMGEGLDKLIRTLTAAGLNPLGSPTVDSMVVIRSDDQSSTPVFDLRSVLGSAMAAAANAVITGDSSTQSQSIQQLLMVDYITSGNEMLYSQMNDLQKAVNLNQTILSYLNSLQDLMNQKEPEHFIMQLQYLNEASPDYAKFEQTSFGDTVLGTVTNFSDVSEQSIKDYIEGLNSSGAGTAQGAFEGVDPDTGEVGGGAMYALQRIKDNLTALINLAKDKIGAQEGASVLSQLKIVLSDFTAINSIALWIQNFSNNNEGTYQAHLNDAVVAAESLNDTQREKLQQTMFVYQSFYQSATSMLNSLQTLMQTLASNINSR